MSYYTVGLLFCKFLIHKGKLRVALEWIHSRHARAAKVSRLGRYNARPNPQGMHKDAKAARQDKVKPLHCEALKRKRNVERRNMKQYKA